jgi:hypothetical protein
VPNQLNIDTRAVACCDALLPLLLLLPLPRCLTCLLIVSEYLQPATAAAAAAAMTAAAAAVAAAMLPHLSVDGIKARLCLLLLLLLLHRLLWL